jgi:hypothetical protein
MVGSSELEVKIDPLQVLPILFPAMGARRRGGPVVGGLARWIDSFQIGSHDGTR